MRKCAVTCSTLIIFFRLPPEELQLVNLCLYYNWNFPISQPLIWIFPIPLKKGESMLIERILELMGKNKITAKKLTTDLELSNSSITDWKKGKGKPSTEAVIKIANYFNVSTDYLLLGKEATTSLTPDQKDWIELISKLPIEKRCEFKGEIKGYLRYLEGESVAANTPKRTGTDNLGK